MEIKSLAKLTSRAEAQLLNYLKATNMPLGLLINFGASNDLEWKRMIAADQPSIASRHREDLSVKNKAFALGISED